MRTLRQARRTAALDPQDLHAQLVARIEAERTFGKSDSRGMRVKVRSTFTEHDWDGSLMIIASLGDNFHMQLLETPNLPTAKDVREFHNRINEVGSINPDKWKEFDLGAWEREQDLDIDAAFEQQCEQRSRQAQWSPWA